MNRRGFMKMLGAATMLAGAGRVSYAQAGKSLPQVVVHKDPNCGCCGAWADHLRANGFPVKVLESRDMAKVKARLGVPGTLHSCHTAEVANYVVEGHVPADSIKRLLKEKPAVKGLAVPGMPLGSPGMEVGDKRQPYDVLAFDTAGKTSVFTAVR